MTKYKYSRKELVKKWRKDKSISFERDLLATKPEKECKHKFIDSFDVIGKVSEFCCKCGKQNPNCGIRWDIPRITTPSPLDEIGGIEIETDLSTGKKYMDGLKLNQVDEILINKINLMILFINSLNK